MNFTSPHSPEKLVTLLAEALPLPAAEGIDRVQPDLIGEALFLREIVGSEARPEEDRRKIVERAHSREQAGVVETLVLAAQDLASGTALAQAFGG